METNESEIIARVLAENGMDAERTLGVLVQALLDQHFEAGVNEGRRITAADNPL